MIGRFSRKTALEIAKQQLHKQRSNANRERKVPRMGKGPPISFVGHRLSLDSLDHILEIGSSGGGKTLTLGPTFRTMVEAVNIDPTRKLLVLDTKGDATQALEGMNVEYHLITFSSQNGFAPDFAKDFSDFVSLVQLCRILIPTTEGNNAFFRNAARGILLSETCTLHDVTKNAYGIDDIVNFATAEIDTIKAILARTEIGQRILNSFFTDEDDETLYKVRSELSSWLLPLMPTAAKCQVSELLSVVDFWKGKTESSILVIKLSPDRLEAERAAATALLQRSLEFIMGLTPPSDPKKLRKDKIIFIDDLNFYRRIPKFLEATELIRGCGGLLVALSQSVEGLRSKNSYGDEADALLANFANILMLRTSSPITAKWFSDLFGKTHKARNSWGTNYGKEGSQGRVDQRQSTENIVLDRDFLNMPPPSPEDGITCYLKTQTFGEEIEKKIPWDQIISRHAPKGSVDFFPLPPQLQIPAPWSDERRNFLCYGIVSEETDEAVADESIFEDAMNDFVEEIRRVVFDLGFAAVERLIKPRTGKEK
ncbi:MAG: type IV secretion system DNA-binding domain-containing protein [Cyanobacteria bacterium P01_D01_bin.56]